MESLRIQTGDTERIEVMVLSNDLTPLTGKTDILLSIRRVSDEEWFDFDAGELDFKSVGWVAQTVAMTETDATLAPGNYHYDFDTSTIDGPNADDTYQVHVDQSPGTDAANMPQTGEIKVGHFVDDIDQSLVQMEDNIRGADDDDLQDLSVQLDTAQTDLNTPAQYQADVSALATTAQLAAAQTNIIGEIDANETKIDAITTTLSTMVADVWAHGTRTLTSFGTLVADITTAVWIAGSRTLTSFGTLVTDITNAVWAAGSRTLTSFGTLVTDIWAFATRTLTSFGTLISDIDTQLTGSHGSGDWITADVSALATAANLALLQTDVTFLKDVAGGRWLIDEAANQMILYESDNATEVARFNLYDVDGNPAYQNLFERRRV